MKRQRGQALTEYVMVVGALSLALFVPWSFIGGKSVFVYLIDVFDIYLDSFHTVLSLPVP